MDNQSNQDFLNQIENFLAILDKHERELDNGIVKLEKHLVKDQVFSEWVKNFSILLEIKGAQKALLDLKNVESIAIQEDKEFEEQIESYVLTFFHESYIADYVKYFPQFLQEKAQDLFAKMEHEPVLKSIYTIHDYIKTQKISKEKQLSEAMRQWDMQNMTAPVKASVKESVMQLKKLKKEIFDYQKLQFEELISQLIQIHQLDSREEAIALLKKGIKLLINLHIALSEKIAKEIEKEVDTYRKIEVVLDKYMEDSRNTAN